MHRPAGIDPRKYVMRRLDEAGETLMALPGRGCFPGGYRSSMPEYLHLPDSDSARINPYLSASRADRPRPQLPSSAAITHMDEVYLKWIPLLPARTDLEIRTRRLVLLRTLVFPLSEREDPHVWSWRRLAEHFCIVDHTAKSRFDRAVDLLTWRLDRLPPVCAATLNRITRQAARTTA